MDMLRMIRGRGDAQLILEPVWDPYLMFVAENKNKILDFAEGIYSILNLLVQGSSQPLKMQFLPGQFDSSFPHTLPQTQYTMRSIDGQAWCRCIRDHAGQSILSLFYTRMNDQPRWKEPAQLFGVIVKRYIQDDAQIQENGEADERGDDSPIEGCDGGLIGASKDAILGGEDAMNEEEHESGSGDDGGPIGGSKDAILEGEDAMDEEEHDSGSGDDESSEGSVGPYCGAARLRNPPRSPEGEATQGSNFTLKRLNATSQHSTPPVILQFSLCFWCC
jgi:hypothetical protein